MDSSVRSLSSNPNRPCFFLQYGDTFILLDCAWDFQPSLKFLPVTQIFTPSLAQMKPWEPAKLWYSDQSTELFVNDGHVLINGAPQGEVPQFQYVDPADIHYILLSNFSQIFALPHLLNGKNFTGKIFATAPTIQLGKDIFQDVTQYLETYSTGTHAEKWKSRDYFSSLPLAFQQCRPELWKPVCSMEVFEASLKKIEVINFRQVIPLENSISITAFSSGFAMGSCNWVIESPGEKICYLSDSTTLTTHVAPVDLEDLKKADVMIVSSLNMEPTRVVGESLKAIGRSIIDTVKNGGNVLIPFSNPDVLIDLLEYLYLYLEDLPTTIPINVISATARSILSLSQVFSEWLAKEYRDKAYLPEEPFVHGEMVKNSRLKIFPSVDGKFSESYVVPCITFCSHHSLRCGPAVHLMSQWKTSPRNCLILTDPEFPEDELLAPYRPLAMKVVYYPMDTRLNLVQLSKILAVTEPKTVILHEKYLTDISLGSVENGEMRLKCPAGTTVETYSEHKEVPLSVGHKWLKTVAHSAFLSSIPMREISDGVGKKVLVGRIYGKIQALDNEYILEPAIDHKKLPPVEPKYPMVCLEQGDIWKLVRLLMKEGVDDVVAKVPEGGQEAEIKSEKTGLTITVQQGRVEVTTSRPTKETRAVLRKVMSVWRAPNASAVYGVQEEDPSVLKVVAAPPGMGDSTMEVDPASLGPDLALAIK